MEGDFKVKLTTQLRHYVMEEVQNLYKKMLFFFFFFAGCTLSIHLTTWYIITK